MKKLAFIFLYRGLDYTEQINLLKIGLNDRFEETPIFYFVEERKKEIITDSVTGEIIDTGRYRQHTQAEILEEIQKLYLKVCNFEVVFVHEEKVLKYVKDFWNVKKINLKVDKEDPKSFLYFQSKLHKVFYKIPKVKFETVYENKKALALLDETLELFMKGDIDHILFDTETTGFCPHKNRIFMFSFADTHRHIGYTIPIWTNTEFNDEKISSIEEMKIKRKLGEVLKHVPISGHNLKFDLQFLETADIITIQDVKIKTDTHLFAHFLYNDFMGKSSLNLAALCQQFLKVSWKDEIKDYLNENFRKSEQSFDKAPTALVAEYAAKDAAYNLVLEEYFRSFAPKAAQKFNDEVLNNIVKIVASIECKGIKIDETLESQLRSFYGTMAKDHYLKLINLPSVVKLKENIPAVKERLEFQAKKNSRAKQYTKEELIDKHFSLQSNPQVADLLYNHFRLKPLTDKPSADKETLKSLYEKYKDDHPEFADFYNHFKYWKRFTKLTADLNRITDNSINGFFHPNYVIVGTRTGRMSSGFHTTDNKSDLKRLYVSRWKDEGGLILSPDFCLEGNTEILLLDGTTRKIKDLVGLEEFYVYSYCTKNNQIETGKAHSCRMVRKTKVAYEIILDTGGKIICTPEHKFMLNDTNEYKEAKDLKLGDSLRSTKWQISERNYNKGKREVYTGKQYSWEFSMYLSDRYNKRHNKYKDIVYVNRVVHHKDFTKLNDNPTNLEAMEQREHRRIHAKEMWTDPKIRDSISRKSSEQIFKQRQDPEFLRKLKIGQDNKDTSYISRMNKDPKYIAARMKGYNKVKRERLIKVIQDKLACGIIPSYLFWDENVKSIYKGGNFNSLKCLKKSLNCTVNTFTEFITDVFPNIDTHVMKEVYFRNSIEKSLSRSKFIVDYYKQLQRDHGKVTAELWEDKRISYEVACNKFQGEANFHRYCKDNHRIVSIKEVHLDEPIETYCFTVDEFHNFFLANGVLSSNSQAEVRVVASLSKEDSLIEAYEKGYDIHRVTASKTFNIPIEDVTHDQRQQGKTLVFSIIYGKSAKGLGETLGISTNEAEKLLKQFFDGHPNLKRWIETQKDHASKFACVETPWGRRIPIDKINSGHFFKKLAAERKCGNAPVQSAASDAVLWSAARIQETLQHYKLKSLIIGMVHDSFEVDVYPGELVQVLNIFKDTCEKKLREFNPWILAPIEISMELGLSWGDGCIEFEVDELSKDSIKIKGQGLRQDALELKRSLSKSYTVKADIDDGDGDASKENFRPEQFITGKNVNLNLEISQ